MTGNKILLTGAHGFIGTHVKAEFANYHVSPLRPTSKELDLTDRSMVMDYFDKTRPAKVLHLAALCAGIFGNIQRPADFLHVNLKMASNLFDACLKYNVEYFAGLGSVCSYPLHCPTPFKEDDLLNGAEEPSNKPYGDRKSVV